MQTTIYARYWNSDTPQEIICGSQYTALVAVWGIVTEAMKARDSGRSLGVREITVQSGDTAYVAPEERSVMLRMMQGG